MIFIEELWKQDHTDAVKWLFRTYAVSKWKLRSDPLPIFKRLF